MKKIISIILTLAMLFCTMSAFADTDTSAAMQTALVSVKQKIDVPAELEEFSSSLREYNGAVRYSFNWKNEDGSKSLSVSCDNKGRINSYHYYDEALYTEKFFTNITNEEIIKFADSFIRRLAPEAFADTNDTLVLNDENISGGALSYYISYDRYKNGSLVKDNHSSVTVKILDEKMYVRDANIGFDYINEFEEPKTEIADYKEKYAEAFPIELIYKNKDKYNYVPLQADEKDEIILEYRITDNSAGYISAETGEIVTEDASLYASGGGSDSSKNEAAADRVTGGFLTEKELEELDNIKGLISKDEIVSLLKALPSVDFENDMKLESFRVTKDDKENYYITARYDNGKDSDSQRSVNVRFNAAEGKLLSLSNYSYYNTNEKTASKSQKDSADKNILAFIDKTAKGEFANMREKSSEWHKNKLSKNYVRRVNDIDYIDDTMYISYDAYIGHIESYRLDFEDGLEFISPEGVLSPAEGYEAMYKATPLEKIYILSGGKYKLCYALSEFGAEIDAFTGERIIPAYAKEDKPYEYTDLASHWSRETIEKLASANIGFEGDEFKPDEAITQFDLLRLFSAGVHYNSYLEFDEDELYRRMKDRGIISDSERLPNSSLKREDAFVYLIRLASLNKIADAEDIFKVSYADGDMISEGKLGYAAILTGLGVICGNGGYIRPADTITRAEAASMIYKYMLNAK